MKIIGITGGVGAGKSTVLDHLEKQYNACVLQADKIGHLVMEPGGICYGQVIALFGKQIIKNDKTIDRKMVSDVVFAHEEMRQKIAVERPAALQQVPRVYRHKQRRDEPGALAENIAHEEIKEHAPGDAAQQGRDAHSHDAQAEELHKRHDQI